MISGVHFCYTENDFAAFLSLASMKALLTRVQWIVIQLPGQEEGAADLEGVNSPTHKVAANASPK